MKAAIIGFGLDGQDAMSRLTTGDSCVLLGGSDETHAEMLETMLRLESELERIGQPLGEVSPDRAGRDRLADRQPGTAPDRRSGSTTDSSESGRTFRDSSAEELTELSA